MTDDNYRAGDVVGNDVPQLVFPKFKVAAEEFLFIGAVAEKFVTPEIQSVFAAEFFDVVCLSRPRVGFQSVNVKNSEFRFFGEVALFKFCRKILKMVRLFNNCFHIVKF